MNYIYAELNRDLLPKELDLYYGFSETQPMDKLPLTALTCANPEYLRNLGEYTQKYKLDLVYDPAYPYFAYPTKYGQLTQILSNEVYNIIRNWNRSIITVNNDSYYMYCYNNKQAPGFTQIYTFKIK